MTMIYKSAGISGGEVTAKDLALINKYTLEPLTAEDVFVFKISACDTQIDRDFECFSEKALKQMAKLFKGKTIITDHKGTTGNQCARIFDAYVEEVGAGVKRLIVKAYIHATEVNRTLITDIKGGIKKEVSVCVSAKKAVCSICGTDNRISYCRHLGGREYDGELCHFTLDDVTDAYELSFVAVPAQMNAGVTKSYGDKPVTEAELMKSADDEKEESVRCSLELCGAFIFSEENKND